MLCKKAFAVYSILLATAYCLNVYADPCPDISQLPPELQTIPYAEDSNIVLESKRIQIPGILGTFNASIVKHDPGYIMTFRQDIKPINSRRTAIRTGYVHFNEQFEQITVPVFYDTLHSTAHDARIFAYANGLYLLYTYINLENIPFTQWNPNTAHMYQAMAKLDNNYKPSIITELNYSKNIREKNWTPFEYSDSAGSSYLYFMYTFNPTEVIAFDTSGSVKQVVKPGPLSDKVTDLWEKHWGKIRGGTQALLLDNEYLTFFHSCFLLSNKSKCYVFGALTFEKEYPFRIRKISPHPIITRDFYTTIDCECWQHRLVKKNVMFPCGLAQGNKNGCDVLYVTSGENDHVIKLITIDTKKLLKNLVEIKE